MAIFSDGNGPSSRPPLGGVGSGIGAAVGDVVNGASNIGAGIARNQPWSPPVQPSGTGRYAPAPVPQSNPGPIQPVAPPPPSIDAYLNADTGYQQQLRDLANSLGMFNADITRRTSDLNTNFDNSSKALNDQKIKDMLLMQDDYGARGLGRSGLYGKAVSDYNTEFGHRMTDLQTQENQALGDLTQQQNQYTSQNQLQQQAAKEDAIRRRAAQYGL